MLKQELAYLLDETLLEFFSFLPTTLRKVRGIINRLLIVTERVTAVNEVRDLSWLICCENPPVFQDTSYLVQKLRQTLAYAAVRFAKITVFSCQKNVRKVYANRMQSVWHLYGTFDFGAALTFDATPLPFSR